MTGLSINRSVRRQGLALFVALSVVSPLVFGEESPVPQPASPTAAAPSETPATFYLTWEILFAAYPDKLAIPGGPEYAGSSLLPFGSRDKAIAEAKANAQKSPLKAFVLTYDQEERIQTMLLSGVGRVIRLRGVALVDRTPENALRLINTVYPRTAGAALETLLKSPMFATTVPRMKEILRQDRPHGVSLPVLVAAVSAQEGKAASEDLKKWAKYHADDQVRYQAYLGLISIGELDFVETTLPSEKNPTTRLRAEEHVRKARLAS